MPDDVFRLEQVEHDPWGPPPGDPQQLAATMTHTGPGVSGVPAPNRYVQQLGPSWLEQARTESEANAAAWAQGGPEAMLRRDPRSTMDVAGGFGVGLEPVRGVQLPLHAAGPAVESAAAAAGRGAVRAGGLPEAPTAPAGAGAAPLQQPGVEAGGGGGALAEAIANRAQAAAGRPNLVGLPTEGFALGGKPYIPGPVGFIHDLAEGYMRGAGLPYDPPKTYAGVDTARAGRIAAAFDAMPHNPADPATAASYDAMINETLAQYQAAKKSGVKFEFIKPGQPDPYAESPRLAQQDVEQNHHLWVFPTETGFGSSSTELANNPLLRPTNEFIDGHRLVANDVFRIVHDFFGHLKDGNGFRAAGEENAWRSHSAMYSDAARPAMTTETRGQNSWLNYGPHGATNRTAKSADTVYADQKIGLLPDWVVQEGRGDAPEAFGGFHEPPAGMLGTPLRNPADAPAGVARPFPGQPNIGAGAPEGFYPKDFSYTLTGDKPWEYGYNLSGPGIVHNPRGFSSQDEAERAAVNSIRLLREYQRKYAPR